MNLSYLIGRDKNFRHIVRGEITIRTERIMGLMLKDNHNYFYWIKRGIPAIDSD